MPRIGKPKRVRVKMFHPATEKPRTIVMDTWTQTLEIRIGIKPVSSCGSVVESAKYAWVSKRPDSTSCKKKASRRRSVS